MGNESCLRCFGEKIAESFKGINAIEVIGMNMEENKEAIFTAAVEKACEVLGNVDVFLHCYNYEGELNKSEGKSSRVWSVNFLQNRSSSNALKTTALEFGKYQIQVNEISRCLHLGDMYPTSIGKERAEKLVKDAVPLHRWLDVESDLASKIIYLISDGSRFMTGTIIFVDGCLSLTRPRMRSYM
ncbi:hypothetical protein Ancab_035495 [Ancistrocladus abbreviatus]